MSALTASIPSNVDPIALIEQADIAESTKSKYVRAIQKYLATGANLGDSQALTAYAQSLSQSGRAFLKAAVKLWIKAIEAVAKSQATVDNVAAIQAALYRLEAVNEAIALKVDKKRQNPRLA